MFLPSPQLVTSFQPPLGGGADKSLARLTSRCRRTESFEHAEALREVGTEMP